jgi:hypothetical protein
MKSWIICIKTKGFSSKYGKYQNGYPQLEGWGYFVIGIFFSEEIWSYILFKKITFRQLVFFQWSIIGSFVFTLIIHFAIFLNFAYIIIGDSSIFTKKNVK